MGSLKERKGLTAMKGAPLVLVGNPVAAGDKAPDFKVISNDLVPVTLGSYRGKALVIASVPSLDTSVCDIETRRFNQEASALGGVTVLTISMDLPFAQKRWCGAADVRSVVTLSDHKEASFGKAYGVLIKEKRLLARAVFVVDREGTVRYAEIVDDLSHEPNYKAALDAARKVV